ncbi:MAG: hypothetical protein Q7T55_06905 [Solirubrobacteraceae bacterium]|nr:hypothetical protein [Solirubrobacteraceae bacterium]
MSAADHSLHPARLLDDGRKLAGFAAIVFIVSLFMPWYEKSVLPAGSKAFVTTSISAFGAFTWVEAALLLVDAAVIGLLYLRSTDRRVELPGSDGTMVAIAGGWMVFLLIVRVFDRPNVEGDGVAPTVGLQWGLLIAMAAAGAILAAGLATRAIERSAKVGGAKGDGPKGGGTPSDEAPESPEVDPSEEPTRFGPYGSSLGGRPPTAD